MSPSILFIVIFVIAVIVFDVWIIWKKGKHESLSAYIIRGSRAYPLIVFLCGIVAGHLLWPMRTDDIYRNVKCVEVDNDFPNP